MYQLLVSGNGWNDNNDTMYGARVFEVTDDSLQKTFKPAGIINNELIRSTPAIFVSELNGSGSQVARVGTILNAKLVGRDYHLEYFFDPKIRGIPNSTLQSIASDLDINAFQFERTHWSIKQADLFRALLRGQTPSRISPQVFTFADPEQIDDDLIAVMMPFHPTFDAVYASLRIALNLKA
jgi:hypothetical protein